MEPTKDGGPAFARPGFSSSDYESQEGMSLRDYFAAAALTGLIAAESDTSTVSPSWLASKAYSCADFMITQRNEK